MTLVIVPNALRDAIYTKLDAAKDRDALYEQLLAYFDEHGVIPDFSLKPLQEPTHA